MLIVEVIMSGMHEIIYIAYIDPFSLKLLNVSC